MSPIPHKHDPEALVCITKGEFDTLCKNVDDIRMAVIGDERYGHRGLILRVNVVERVLIVIAGLCVIFGGDKVLTFLIKHIS